MTLRKIALLLFLVNLLLVWPSFLPNLSDINAFDEASYINSGHDLLDRGIWPNFAGSPLSSVFYALTYLPFHSSPFWLVQACSLGRVLLFTLLWWSAYLVAEAVGLRLALLVPGRASAAGDGGGSDGSGGNALQAPGGVLAAGGSDDGMIWLPLVVGGLLLVTSLATDMLHFPSDPLFAGLAALSLWQMLAYHENRRLKNLAWASGFMGLAALARNDGLAAFAVLAGLAVLLQLPPFRDHSAAAPRMAWGRLARTAAALLLPFALLVGGYLVFFYLHTGRWEMGTLERTYLNFEAGQQVIYGGEGEQNIVIESRREAQRLFGSGEENDYSVLRAIQRNPAAYMERLVSVVKSLPERLLRAYGIRFAAVLFLLAGGGALKLLRRKQYGLLLLLALWPAHLASGFLITLFRPGHLQFPFYVIFALAGIGLLALLRALPGLWELRRAGLRAPGASLALAWLLILAALAGFGLATNKLAIFYNAVVVLAALLVVWLTGPHRDAPGGVLAAGDVGGSAKTGPHPGPLPQGEGGRPLAVGEEGRRMGLALLVLLAAGLVLHGEYPSPRLRTLGVEAREQAVVFMAENLERGSLVAAAAPATVWGAHMTFANLTSLDVPSDKSAEDFVAWLRGQGIRAVYVDQVLTTNNPPLWALLEAQIGAGLERAFLADEGDVQILIVK